jgi:hypothetical protein
VSTPTATVTVPASQKILVLMSAQMSNSTNNQGCRMSFSGGGITASDARSAFVFDETAATLASAAVVVTGVTAGSQTLSANYSRTGGTCTILNRSLSAIPLP